MEKESWKNRIVEYEPLAKHTSWRIGGPSRFYLEANTIDELRAALQWSHEYTIPVFILGGGTNVLVRDTGFAGLTLRYRASTWRIDDHGEQGLLYLDADTPIGRLVWTLGAQGWSNLEWAAGLPGSAGGAVCVNAGCYGGNIASILNRAWVLVGDDVQEWTVAQFAYGYRTSILNQANPIIIGAMNASSARIVLAAEMRLVQGDKADLVQNIKHIATLRKNKTPDGSSCGSVFKNPTGIAQTAGQLIDAAGLKGTRIGTAEISQRHANYIVNLGGASSEDVVQLIEVARTTVLQQFGVELELEVQMIP